MKRLILLLSSVLLFSFNTFFANGGIKPGKTIKGYFQHDPIKAFNILEQKAGHKINVEWSHLNSTPAMVWGGLTKPGYSSTYQKSTDGIRFISENNQLFGIKEAAKELLAVSESPDIYGMVHVKYQQMLNGLKVYPCQLIVHFNSDGSVESVNGNYIPSPVMNTVPEINAFQAASIAKSKLNNYKISKEECELEVYLRADKIYLAYEVKLPSNDYPDMRIFVDAIRGEVIKIDNGIRYDGPAKGKGMALDGRTVNINTYQMNGKFCMLDASLPMYTAPIDSFFGVIATYDAQNDTNGNGYTKVDLISDPDNDNNFSDNERLRSAVNAHMFSNQVYNFYKSVFNRNSFSNNGKTILNVVHYKEKYNNAFWNGFCMTYGDGDGEQFSNLAGALDVIMHEYTHAVTSSTADLVYELQSGALNESISDAFASLIDSTNWLIGEDVVTPAIAGDGLRSMQDPHNGQAQGDLAKGWLPASMNEFVNLPNNEQNDWGGVHINSGIPNKAFYNVASVIGHYKAGQIWYRSLTVYLTKNSQFTDFRNACLLSAKDIFGAASNEYKTVQDAFTSVGITDQTVSITDIQYDDGNPDSYVYEQLGNWELAVKFTPAVKNSEIQSVKVYIAGDVANRNGQFKLVLYEASPASGLPDRTLISPFSYVPPEVGWHKFDLSNVKVTNDFFVSVLYDGVGYPAIGADVPPGNGKAYEFDPNYNTWYKLSSPNDYTLFMRATVRSVTSDVEIDTKIPEKFVLEQNYPNPFNPSTTIRYSLPEETDVQIIIYNSAGSQVAELVNNHQNAGHYNVNWNGKNQSGLQVSSGVYYYKIKAGSFVKTNKMLLIK